MSKHQTEMNKRDGLRLSNMESNKLTRECIESALLFLMKDKVFAQISISEIVKKAGVSRTAYYRNYASKEDILRTILQELIADINEAMEQFSESTESLQYWKAMFEVTKIHANSLDALLKAGMAHMILEEITDYMKNLVPEEDLTGQYEMVFWGGAIFNLLINWYQSGMQHTEAEMAKICVSIIEQFND